MVGAGPANVFLYNNPALPNYTYNWVIEGVNTTLSTNSFLNDFPTLTGNYSYVVTVTDTSGCVASDTLCVIVSLTPQVTVIPATPGVLCAGTVYSFTANATPPNPNYIYQWSNGVNTAVMSTGQPGTYSCNVINPASGCVGFSNIVTIGRRPSAILFPAGCDSLCDTTTVMPPLALGGAATYAIYTIQWFDFGNYGSPIFTGSPLPLNLLSPGPHQLSMVVTFGGCSDTSNVYNLIVKNCSFVIATGLLNFKAQRQGKNALLKWEVPLGNNDAQYELLHATDGRQFNLLETISSVASQTQYQYIDALPKSGIQYYQLKIKDRAGAIRHSAIQSLDFGYVKDIVSIYPNPVNTNLFTIKTTDLRHKQIRIYDCKGIQIFTKNSTTAIDQIAVGQWQNGNYWVQIIGADGALITRKLILIR
jgi:hypothetical protein